MANEPMNTKLFDEAAVFAINAHKNTKRRGKNYPYILHCMEAAQITSTITDDPEIIAAAILHDTVEDTSVTLKEIEEKFGKRVARLVDCETEEPGGTWHERRERALNRIKGFSKEEKTVILGDKLSNLRAIARDYREQKDEIWKLFSETDPKEHKWRYQGLKDALSELSGTDAYEEFEMLINQVFKDI